MLDSAQRCIRQAVMTDVGQSTELPHYHLGNLRFGMCLVTGSSCYVYLVLGYSEQVHIS